MFSVKTCKNDVSLVIFIRLLSKKGYAFRFNMKDYKSPYGLLGNLKKRYTNYKYKKYYLDFPLVETVHVFNNGQLIGQFSVRTVENSRETHLLLKLGYGFISPNGDSFNHFNDFVKEIEFLKNIGW